MGVTVAMYAQENSDDFPTFRMTYPGYGPYDWRKQIAGVLNLPNPDTCPAWFHCPSSPETDPSQWRYWCSYGCNAHLGVSIPADDPAYPYFVRNINEVADPTRTIMLFDLIAGNPHGRHGINVWELGNQDIYVAFRHSGKVNLVFCDGHVGSRDGPITSSQLCPR